MSASQANHRFLALVWRQEVYMSKRIVRATLRVAARSVEEARRKAKAWPTVVSVIDVAHVKEAVA